MSVYVNPVEVMDKYRAQISEAIGRDDWSFYHETWPTDEKFDIGRYRIEVQNGERKTVVASFRLEQMIGCCGICVSTSSQIYGKFQGKGLGTILNLLRIDIAKWLGYGILMCTDIEKNVAQRKILKKNGWTDIHNFVNPRTKNTVYISIINL